MFVGGLGEIQKCYDKRVTVMYKHNKDLAEVQDALAKCYAQLGKSYTYETYQSTLPKYHF